MDKATARRDYEDRAALNLPLDAVLCLAVSVHRARQRDLVLGRGRPSLCRVDLLQVKVYVDRTASHVDSAPAHPGSNPLLTTNIDDHPRPTTAVPAHGRPVVSLLTGEIRKRSNVGLTVEFDPSQTRHCVAWSLEFHDDCAMSASDVVGYSGLINVPIPA